MTCNYSVTKAGRERRERRHWICCWPRWRAFLRSCWTLASECRTCPTHGAWHLSPHLQTDTHRPHTHGPHAHREKTYNTQLMMHGNYLRHTCRPHTHGLHTQTDRPHTERETTHTGHNARHLSSHPQTDIHTDHTHKPRTAHNTWHISSSRDWHTHSTHTWTTHRDRPHTALISSPTEKHTRRPHTERQTNHKTRPLDYWDKVRSSLTFCINNVLDHTFGFRLVLNFDCSER